jgi:DNA-directed RNA polymerase subunit F
MSLVQRIDELRNAFAAFEPTDNQEIVDQLSSMAQALVTEAKLLGLEAPQPWEMHIRHVFPRLFVVRSPEDAQAFLSKLDKLREAVEKLHVAT